MKRILQVCNTDFYLSRFLFPLVRELKNRGYHVECLCAGQQYSPEFKKLGIPVHQFSFPQTANPFEFIRSTHQMKKFLREHQFDCVNSHNRNASIVARIAAWRAHVPLNLYTAHGFYFHDAQSKFTNWLTELFEGLMAKITSYTLSQSDEDTRRMIEHNWIPANKIKTIGNGIDTDKFSPRQSKDEACKKLGLRNVYRVAAVGRMVRNKGFDDLIHAFDQFQKGKNVELHFIGGNIAKDIDPVLEEHKRLIRDLGLTDRVTITGLVENVEDHLAASDVFVIPSYREGVPRALLEAMCLGLPCIATNIRGNREVIQPGIDGWLYEARNHDQLREQLEAVYGLGEKRTEYGGRARQKVLKSYSEDAYVKRQCTAIEELLNKQTLPLKLAVGD